MRATKQKRSSKYQDYKFILETLRWILANKVQVVRVAEHHSVHQPKRRSVTVPTLITIEIVNLPIGHRDHAEFLVKPTALTRFLEGPEFRKQFIAWYAKQIADSISRAGGSAKLVERFSRLTVGRPTTVPPKVFLRAEYDKLVPQVKELQSKAKLPIDRKQSETLLQWGRETSALWMQMIDAGRISIDELSTGSPQDAAKLILSKAYGCTEEAIHSRLFRTGK